jgi:CDP-glucose 4,6-dehydratase
MENMEGLNDRATKTLAQKSVLVTGGTGFVGAHLVQQLVNLGAHVITTYQTEDPASYFASQELSKEVVMVKNDITNYNAMLHLITRYQVAYIFHLAAQPLVDVAFLNPLHTIQTNVMGTANVLEAARQYGMIKGVIVASSDKAYGKLTQEKYTETDKLFGDHPYDMSKSATDLLCNTYYKTYNLPVVTTRFGNIYGEGDLNYSRLIPGIMQAVAKDEPLLIRSNGKYLRDYLYVKDVVLGYLLLAVELEKTIGQAYNFGSSDTLTVLEVVKTAQKSLHKKIPHKILNIAKNEIPYQSLSFEKVTQLGWKPTVTMDKVLPKIYTWYMKRLLLTI